MPLLKICNFQLLSLILQMSPTPVYMQPTDHEETRFTRYLNSMHLRKTPERYEILRAVLTIKAHFDVDSLYNILEANSYHVSKATIYSTLQLLCNCGIVRKLLFDTHQAKYEIAGASHSHVICTRCGAIMETGIDGLLSNPCSLPLKDFSPSYVSVCIYGVCDKCRKESGLQSQQSNN